MENTQKLQEYLVKKLNSIYQIYASYENDLIRNKINLANSGLSEEDFGQIYHRLEYLEGNLFRQAMLIMVCSYLEEAMNLIGELVISDYSKKINKRKEDSWFEKSKGLFENFGISFKDIGDECERFNDLRIVRNCIVHSGGNIEKFKYPMQVKEAVEKLKERDKEKNMKLVDILDKFIYLGEDTIVTAIIAAKRIIEQLHKPL